MMPKALLLDHPEPAMKVSIMDLRVQGTVMNNIPGAFDQEPGFDNEGTPKGCGGAPQLFPL